MGVRLPQDGVTESMMKTTIALEILSMPQACMKLPWISA